MAVFAVGSLIDTNYVSDLSLSRDYYRGLIAKPAGASQITGVALFNGVGYCLRDQVDGTTAVLYKESTSGWTAVRSGLRPGGSLRTVAYNFTGATATRKMYGCDGKNRYWYYDGTTFAFGPVVYGTEASSASAITPGLGAKTFAATETARLWANGQVLLAYSAASAANYLIGTVTSSTTTSVTINCTSFGGVAAADWHICMYDGSDRPFDIAAHRQYLFFAYLGGQLQTSDNGNPITFATTAAAFTTGNEIRALTSLRGEVLGIFCQQNVQILYGSGATTDPWRQKVHSRALNCRAGSAIEVAGDGVFISDAGVQVLTGTQDYGDFNGSNLAGPARSSQLQVVSDYRCAAISRKDSQYRVYGASSTVLVMSFNQGVVNAQTVQFTKLVYGHQATCVASESYGNQERIIFGTADGWVMQDRSGTNFDGVTIGSFFKTTYWHHKMPQQHKRWRKLVIDLDNDTDAMSFSFYQDFDFSQVDYLQPHTYDVSIDPPGGRYDIALHDQHVYDGVEAGQAHINVDGVGRYMSIVFFHAQDIVPFVVRGIHHQFTPLRLQR